VVRPLHVDVKQAVFQGRALDLQPIGEDEASDKAPCRDAAMQEGLLGLAVRLALAGDGQLAAFKGDVEVVGRKARLAARSIRARVWSKPSKKGLSNRMVRVVTGESSKEATGQNSLSRGPPEAAGPA
jgi:hypothetical protein